MAGLVPAVGHTLVVVIFGSSFAGSANACHSSLTIPAEQFGAQYVIFESLCTRRGFFLFVHHILHLVKQVIADDSGQSVRGFCASVSVNSNIPLVAENAIEAVFVELVAVGGFDMVCIKVSDNISHRLAAGVHLKNFLHNRSGVRINLNMFLAVYTKAQCQISACGKTFFGVDVHAPPYLLREFDTIIFCHSLQHGLHQHTRGIIRDILTGGQYTDTVLFELGFVGGAVVTVAGKAIKLIDQYGLKELFVPVRNHTQKFRTVIGCAGNGTVNVFPYNGIAVAPCVLIALFQLSFNTLFGLAIRRVAGIDYDIHLFHSFLCATHSR